MRIPTKAQCYRLMCAMEMLDHIAAHCIQVCRVATFLAGHLNARQSRLNLELIRAAALLHDITKTRSFKTKENHALTGGRFLAEQGYPHIGDLVRQHVRLDHYADPPQLGEAEIINYADKRVLHDRIVSLDQRLDYILEKYGQLPEHRERIRRLWERTRKLEARIFGDLPFDPQDLNLLLDVEMPPEDFHEYRQVCRSGITKPIKSG
ncbi:MAG: HD domain-containing protein [Desulfobacteraceae bacterium]|jgi:putative nucleotidyltransferase with HDIG domain|nr:HD domain-containing protein [Desulfobacteraceae bacterium]